MSSHMNILAASAALLFAVGLSGCDESPVDEPLDEEAALEEPLADDPRELDTITETPEQDDAFAKQNSDPLDDPAGDLTAGEQRDRAVYGGPDQAGVTPEDRRTARESGIGDAATPPAAVPGEQPPGEIGAFEGDESRGPRTEQDPRLSPEDLQQK